MSKNKDKALKSEFEEKLQESIHQPKEGDNLSHSNVAHAPASPHPGSDHSHTSTDQYERTIPVIEEQVEIGSRVVETADVYISKSVHEDEVNVDLPTIQEEVDVERVPINQYVDSPPPAVRHEGDKMIIPVLREELVVVKRILVVEELHVTKKQNIKHDSEKIRLLKEEVHVNRVDKDPSRPA